MFEHDPNLTVIKRSGYTILDWIANVGGLRAIICFTCSYLMSYWSFNYPQNFMVSRLFKYQKSGSDTATKQGTKDKEQHEIDGDTNGILEYLRSTFTCCFKSKSDQQKVLCIGRAQLSKEINIVTII